MTANTNPNQNDPTEPRLLVIHTYTRLDPERLHISQVESKDAVTLSTANMIDDWYHNNIQRTARRVANYYHPFGDEWHYVTQYGSGNCCWQCSRTGRTRIISAKVNKED